MGTTWEPNKQFKSYGRAWKGAENTVPNLGQIQWGDCKMIKLVYKHQNDKHNSKEKTHNPLSFGTHCCSHSPLLKHKLSHSATIRSIQCNFWLHHDKPIGFWNRDAFSTSVQVMIENPSWKKICSDSLKPLAQWPWIKYIKKHQSTFNWWLLKQKKYG